MSSERLERIKPVMQAYVDQKGFAGISTLIARKGKIVHCEQVGYMDVESGKPMAADTIFRIYSMTKPLISAALMTLYEQGRFQLTDPVAKFLPAFGKVQVLERGPAGVDELTALRSPMTIHQLLTHTAGLTYDFLEDFPVGELYREARLANDAERTLEEMVQELARLPLAYQPGSTWHYSLAVDVSAHLIELLSGRPLDHFLRETLFEPLAMDDTAFFVPEAKQARLATMYGLPDLFSPHMTFNKLNVAWEQGFNERVDVSVTNPATYTKSFMRGGHGLFSTAGDYLRFAQMMLNGGELDGRRILGRKTVEFMRMNHLPASLLPYVLGEPHLGAGFGLGTSVVMNVAEAGIMGSEGSYGWGGAARTRYWIDPQEEMAGVLMTQYMMGFDQPDLDLRVLAYQALVD